MPKVGTKLTLDFSSLIGPLFFLWLIQLPLPISLVQLVYEKEKRLRMMMRMHGLSTGAMLPVSEVQVQMRAHTVDKCLRIVPYDCWCLCT